MLPRTVMLAPLLLLLRGSTTNAATTKKKGGCVDLKNTWQKACVEHTTSGGNPADYAHRLVSIQGAARPVQGVNPFPTFTMALAPDRLSTNETRKLAYNDKKRNMISYSVAATGYAWGKEVALVLHALAEVCHRDRSAVMVDIGANIGTIGLTAASLGCRVVMIDPVPRNVAYIRASIRANPGWQSRVRVVLGAVSDRRGVTSLKDEGHVTRVGYGGSVANHEKSTVHVVPSLTFDELLSDDELKNAAFLKVDVEGHEAHLVRAASKLHPACMPKLHDITWEIHSATGNAPAVCAKLAPFDFAHTLPIAVKRVASDTVQHTFTQQNLGHWGCNTSSIPNSDDVWFTMESLGMPRRERPPPLVPPAPAACTWLRVLSG